MLYAVMPLFCTVPHHQGGAPSISFIRLTAVWVVSATVRFLRTTVIRGRRSEWQVTALRGQIMMQRRT
ncbi:hypothetical protein DSD19_00280 [Rhodovulum sp. BSW8]|uniref:hypothetical protein n=1 Tax=Rhodovulum sp. BSW8 TaxID=2259645 RepID=UPI000DE22C75|nr:hypothetical protein [Rhodovulum sp. BSW8]RBO55117.1 hypothetical protein DSD19_00280 [Rhodovulum sp. BSW8]